MEAAPKTPAACDGSVYRSEVRELDLVHRELRAQGNAMAPGGRAFEIAEILVRAQGSLVTKDALMRHVWPGAVVEENTLQVHISALRRALGADRTLLKTVQGRGYRLLGTWVCRESVLSSGKGQGVPLPVTDLIGRHAVMRLLHELLRAGRRLVTLTGIGGIGKTVLALHAAVDLKAGFPNSAFVPLAPLAEAGLVPATIAGVLGLRLGGEVSPQSLAHAISTRKLFLFLDNCEHVIEVAAQVADAIGCLCPHVVVLATSREALRSAGEVVVSVPPLALPPTALADPDELLSYSAVQFFVERVAALGTAPTVLQDRLPLVSAICRQLDGIPLALEF